MDGQNVTPQDAPPTDQNIDPNADTGTGGLLLGKYKNADELAKAHEELQRKLGEQGNELGNTKRLNQTLAQQLESAQQAKSAAPSQPAQQYEAMLNDVYSQMDKGEISVEAAIQKSNAITAQMVKQSVLADATTQVKQILSERDAAQVRKEFLDQHPDFAQAQQTGAFQALKAKTPLHDDFSAYFAQKAELAAAKTAQLEAELADAKKVANLAGGDQGTAKVFTKPGGDLRGQKPKPTSLADIKASAMAAVQRVGAG